jgi:hypothetical protein
LSSWVFAVLVFAVEAASTAVTSPVADLPNNLICRAAQTAGFHDYTSSDQEDHEEDDKESYEPVVFFESEFNLAVNEVLTQHLAASEGVDVYLTFSADENLVELRCLLVRGIGDARGLSCSNEPPAEMLLINLGNLRFTRTSIGGWTFAGGEVNTSGDSIFVEYGQCVGD